MSTRNAKRSPPGSPSYSSFVLSGAVGTAHIGEPLNDTPLISVVHLAREATGPAGKGPKRPEAVVSQSRARRRTLPKWTVSRNFLSGASRDRTGDLLLAKQIELATRVSWCRANTCKCRISVRHGRTLKDVARQIGAPLVPPQRS